MPLTPAQLTALKSAIAADATLAAMPNDSDNNLAIADAFNATASPDFWVWRSEVSPAEYCGANGIVWTEVDALSVGKARIFEWMTAGLTRPINPSDPNQRAGLQNAFGSSVTATNLTTKGRRPATRAEKLFATGTGSTGTPATMGREGPLSYFDVADARNS